MIAALLVVLGTASAGGALPLPAHADAPGAPEVRAAEEADTAAEEADTATEEEDSAAEDGAAGQGADVHRPPRGPAPSLALGLGLNDDRGRHPRGLRPTFAAELEVPVIWRLHLRGDLVTPWATEDPLDARGPIVGLMAIYHQPLDAFAADVGLGPTLWTGPVGFWDGAVKGPFPGLRVAAGGRARIHRNLGLRLEVAWAGNRGTHPFLDGWSTGFDTRVMLTGTRP